MSFFPVTAVQKRQHVVAAGRRTLYSRLLSVFVFGILYIPSGYIKLVVGALHPFSLSHPGHGFGSYALLAEDRFHSSCYFPKYACFSSIEVAN
jgi:hypothetical protein